MPYEKLKWRPLRSRKRTCCSAGQSTIARYIILGTSEKDHYPVCKLIRDRQSMSCRWKHWPSPKSLLTKWARPTSLSRRYYANTRKAIGKIRSNNHGKQDANRAVFHNRREYFIEVHTLSLTIALCNQACEELLIQRLRSWRPLKLSQIGF